MTSQRDLVLVSFPFSDLKGSKVRPVIVISNDEYNKKSDDVVVVPMTTNLKIQQHEFLISNKDLESGKLIKDSKVKTDRVLSINKKLVRMKIGKVRKEVHDKIKEILFKLLD